MKLENDTTYNRLLSLPAKIEPQIGTSRMAQTIRRVRRTHKVAADSKRYADIDRSVSAYNIIEPLDDDDNGADMPVQQHVQQPVRHDTRPSAGGAHGTMQSATQEQIIEVTNRMQMESIREAKDASTAHTEERIDTIGELVEHIKKVIRKFASGRNGADGFQIVSALNSITMDMTKELMS